ncbi:MAG: hypothetical protein KKI08_17760 [Armatimonadetes bacterium]|nr:hypothetical protein [Armatimonadota bacterium]
MPRIELMMVLRGRGVHRYRGRVYEYWPGVVFCYGPQERREVALPEWAAGVEVLWVHASPRGVSARVLRCRESRRGWRQRARGPLLLDETGPIGRNPLLDHAFIEELPAATRPLVVRAGVELLVARLVEVGYEEPDRGGEHRTRQAMRFVADFIQYVGGATDVAECARVAGCTRESLVRVFPLVYSSRVQEYIDYCRMEEIARLLRKGWKKKDIATYFGVSKQALSGWMKRRRGRWPYLPEDEVS